MARCQFISRMPEIRRNLLHLWQEVSESDRELGAAWYPRAHRIMVEWAETYGYSIATVACVTAAISPQLEWTRNLVIADDVLAGRLPSIGGVLRMNLRKAERIRDDRAGQITPYFPHGPKVASFACNLGGDYSIVTVDTHAMQAALCDVQANYRLRWQPYSVFAQCYADVANALQIEPATFQAIIWHTWKRLYPRTRKLSERRQWHIVGELED